MARTKSRDGIYQRKDRGGYWARIDGRIQKLPGETLTQARDYRNSLIYKKKIDATMGVNPIGKTTMREVVDRYLKHQTGRVSRSTVKRAERVFEMYMLPMFGDRPLAELGRADMSAYIEARRQSVSNGTVIKEFNILKHLLQLCVVEWEILDSNIAKGIRLPKPSAGKDFFFTEEQMEEIEAASPDWLKPIIMLAVSTGMRRANVIGLKWDQVDLRGNRIVLGAAMTKGGKMTGKPNVIPLTLKAQFVLAEGGKAGRVFTDTRQQDGDYVSQVFKKFIRSLGIKQGNFHTLRHTFASHAAMNGMPMLQLATILGHADIRMVMRYQHLSPKHLQESILQLGGIFATETLPAPVTVTQ